MRCAIYLGRISYFFELPLGLIRPKSEMITPNSVYVEQYVDTAEMKEEEKALQIEQDGNSKILDSL